MKEEIIPGLWVGNWQSAQKSEGMHVITVAIDSPHIGHEHFKLVDGPGNPPELFAAAVDATVKAVEQYGKPVLVHCVGGRSRSCAVAARAVARLRKINIHEAYDLLIAKRDITRIHPALSWLLSHP